MIKNQQVMKNTKKPPKIGMGATIHYHSDRHPVTIMKVSPSLRTVWVSEDDWVRVDNNGISESQSYEYNPSPNQWDPATWLVFTLRKNERYVRKGVEQNTGSFLSIGIRDKYWDPSF